MVALETKSGTLNYFAKYCEMEEFLKMFKEFCCWLARIYVRPKKYDSVEQNRAKLELWKLKVAGEK